jgi:TP901 family phage tail tape measure protein
LDTSYAETIAFRFIGYNLLGTAVREVTGLLRGVAVTSSESTSQIATSMGQAGAGVAALGGAFILAGIAIVGAMALGVAKASEFNSQMILLHTQARVATDQLQALGTGVLQMAGQVGFSADALAQGLYFIESVGAGSYTTAHALDILKAAAEGAAVGHADLATTASVLASVMAVFPQYLPIQAMGQLDAIIGQGKMTMEDLNAAMKTGILATLQASGVSLADFGGALATMTDYAIPASQAANALRMAIYLISAPTAASNKVLQEFGLTTAEASSSSQAWTDALAKAGIRHAQLADDLRKPGGIIVALEDLRTHLQLAGLDAEAQAEVIYKAFGGGKMGKAVITLYENIGGGARASDAELQKLGFTLDEIATLHDRLITKTAAVNAQAYLLGQNFAFIQQNDPAFMWKQFLEATNALIIAFGEAFIPLLILLLQTLTPLVVQLTGFVAAHQDLIRVIFVGAAAFFLIMGAALIFIGILGVVAGALLAIGAIGIGGTILPLVGIFIILAAALVGAAYLIVTHWNEVKAFFAQFTPYFNQVKMVVIQYTNELVSFFKSKLPELQQLINTVLNNIRSFWQQHGTQIIAILEFTWTMIVDTIRVAVTLLEGIISVVLDVLNGNWGKAWSDIQKYGYQIWQNILSYVSDFADGIWAVIGRFVNGILDWFRNLWTKALAFWQDFTSRPMFYVGEMIGWLMIKFAELLIFLAVFFVMSFEKAKQWGIDIWHTIINYFGILYGDFLGWLNKMYISFSSWVVDTFNYLKNNWPQIIGWLVNEMVSWPAQMRQIGVDIAVGVWNGIQSMAGWLGKQVADFFGGIVAGAKKAVGISSPSKMFGDEIGVPMAQGIGVGFMGQMHTIQGQINSTITPASFIGGGITSGSRPSSVNSNTDTPILEDIRDALLQIINTKAPAPSTSVEALIWEITQRVSNSRARGLKGYAL